MATSEIVGQFPESAPPQADPKFALQEDADRLFLERAGLILPSKLGKLVIGPRDLSDRSPDDITNLEHYLIPANPTKTEYVLERFDKLTANVDEVAQQFDATYRDYQLEKYLRLMIISEHPTMFDILGISYATFFTKSLGENRSATDNYMYLSRLLGYAAYRNFSGLASAFVEQKAGPMLDGMPFQVAKRARNYLYDRFPASAPQTVVGTYITPVTNIIQVFPLTKSMEPLREKHSSPMEKANTRANLAAERDKKAKETTVQQLDLMAAPGAQAKPYEDGLKAEPIDPKTMDMLYMVHQRGTPIYPAGLDLDVKLTTLHIPSIQIKNGRVKIQRQDIRFASGEVLLPEHNLERQEFDVWVKQQLRKTSSAVSRKPIY